MTKERELEIQRQARLDVTAFYAGWPVKCRYKTQIEIDCWKKWFDLTIAERKK